MYGASQGRAVSVVTLLLCVVGCLSRPYHRPASYYAPAPVGQDGQVIDTPEVAQAKAAHLAAFSKAASRPLNPYSLSAVNQVHGAYSNPGFYSAMIQHGPYGYQGPPAPLAHDGRVIDTPEVAQAKAAHYAAFSQAASRSYEAGPSSNKDDYNDYGAYSGDDDESSGSVEGHYDGQSTYQGPPAPLAQDGRVIDTPEVAEAKAAHLAVLQRAHSNAPPPVHRRYY
ncbi:pupal cuticle protein-like [Phymastichus coffea]|uniref:pupal cuticle protein-like n=1 Tax=Phymastichus coffea TaxID=108790 RepID=UPI00273C4CE8|nr:pupal cuticle protein-like [Phymastichus coffea]